MNNDELQNYKHNNIRYCANTSLIKITFHEDEFLFPNWKYDQLCTVGIFEIIYKQEFNCQIYTDFFIIFFILIALFFFATLNIFFILIIYLLILGIILLTKKKK